MLVIALLLLKFEKFTISSLTSPARDLIRRVHFEIGHKWRIDTPQGVFEFPNSSSFSFWFLFKNGARVLRVTRPCTQGKEILVQPIPDVLDKRIRFASPVTPFLDFSYKLLLTILRFFLCHLYMA